VDSFAHTKWQLQPDHLVPLYLQLEYRIKAEINSGHWKPGDQIASERDLMRIAGVSRATVRQTLASLTQQGILERKHGRGTFVTRPKFEQTIQAAYSFADQLRALGLHVEDRILKKAVTKTTADMAKLFGLPVGEELIQLERLRLLEDVPLMVNRSFIVYRLCPDLLNIDVGPSLYGLLGERFDLPLLRSTDTLEAIPAEGAIAEHLQIIRGEPIMYTQRIAYTYDDVLLHVGLTYIRGDMCRFRVDMHKQPAQLELKSREALGD
jgi:GntR family transcriptional regulator